ncbi:hypothetical protein BAE44_0020931 [Dichanthelium oligosanthes]|uniref:Uncharacterized protein n=1 Tax=Dichanthelium oligosanthes TaxID=888268 RepID=A0A1E5UYV8_9POAL|nr:hypothetical protein BAE44_0020931 [Dichanthelium oligosanthes]
MSLPRSLSSPLPLSLWVILDRAGEAEFDTTEDPNVPFLVLSEPPHVSMLILPLSLHPIPTSDGYDKNPYVLIANNAHPTYRGTAEQTEEIPELALLHPANPNIVYFLLGNYLFGELSVVVDFIPVYRNLTMVAPPFSWRHIITWILPHALQNGRAPFLLPLHSVFHLGTPRVICHE